MIQAASPLGSSELSSPVLARFESLGGIAGCGDLFAAAQRAAGLSPRGLLCGADMPVETLIHLLRTRLEGVGGPRNILVGPWPNSDEWWTRDPRFPLAIRSGVSVSDRPLSGMTALIRRRWHVLRAQLLDALSTGKRMFVFIGDDTTALPSLDAALRTYPSARLLYVHPPSQSHSAGVVTAWSDRILVAALPRPLAGPGAWQAVCEQALAGGISVLAPIPAPAPFAPATDQEVRLREAAAQSPASAQAHEALARYFAAENRLPEAIDAWRDAVALRPKDVALLSHLGGVQLRAERIGDAVATFRQVVALAPQNATAAGHLAVACQRAGDLPAALAAARRAAMLDPDNPRRLLPLANFLTAVNDIGAAEEVVRQAIAMQPGLPDGHLALSQVLARSGQLPAALEAARAALRLQPNSARALGQVGRIAERVGRFEEAEEALVRAAALEPGVAARGRMLTELRQRQSQSAKSA